MSTKLLDTRILYTGINIELYISQEIKKFFELPLIQKNFVLTRPPVCFPNVFS